MKNIDKVLFYMKLITSEPLYLDGDLISDRKNKFKLSSTFFNSDDCVACGRCCVPEKPLYTMTEYVHIMSATKAEFDADNHLPFEEPVKKLRDSLKEEVYNINGKDVSVWVSQVEPQKDVVPSGKHRDSCAFLWQRDDSHWVCSIHPLSSVTCDMPHLRLFYSKSHDTVSFAMSNYGRNWAIGCPVEFYAPQSEEEFEYNKKNRLRKIYRLIQTADDLNIPTELTKLAQYVEKVPFDNYESYLNKIVNEDVVSKHKKSIHLF